MVLLVDLDLFLQLLGFGETQHLSPVGEDFHPVEVGHLLFLDHLCFQVVSPHLHELTLLVKVIHRPIRVPDSDQDSSMFGLRGRLTFNGFSKLHHLQ